MKKKTALHWDYRAETRGTIKYLLAVCLFGGLMLWSALYMLYDLFPEFRLNGKGVLLAELSAAALVLFHRGFLRYAQRKRIPVLSSLWILAPVSGIYLLGFLLCYLTNRKILTDGTLGIGAVFLKAWNSYYKTALPLPKQNTAAIPEALAFWLLLLFTVFWLLAEIWQKALFLTALPVTALAAGLLVGKAPGWQGIALFVFGILLEEAGEGEHYAANRLKRKEIHRLRQQTVPRLAVLLVCLVMLLTAEHLFSRPVGRLMEKSPDMLKFQKNLETQITSAFASSFTTNRGNVSREKVSNRTPEYSGREVMTVELSQKPEGSVYLRNFYGTDYEDGSWNCDLASFQSAAEKEGFDPTEAALVVSGHPGQILLEQKEEELEYRISYRRGLGREAALPYYICPEESDGLSFFGEGRANRKLSSGKLAFRGSYLADGELMDLEMFALNTEPDDEEREILNWYDGYARNYLQDSDRVPSAADPYLFYPYYDYVSENDLADVKPYLQNWERINLASVVCDSLRQKCSYHLKLQPLPDGMDTVEYFLSESQEGYCMHFASAGTLLLRAFGVPARYASGYIVKRSEFEQSSDGKFTASVKDWNAHAWTEIYLDGIGWVPIEMTPGYEPGRSSLPTVSDGDDRTDSVSEPESESENTQTEEPETEAETETESESETESETETENEAGGDPSQAGTGSKGGEGTFGSIGKGVLYAALLLLLAFLLIRQGIRFKRRYRMQLELEFSRRQYRKAVRRISRRIYQRLRRTGRIRGRMPTNREYERLLAECFPQIAKEDWSRYMQITGKAAFSADGVEEEEARFCRRIYQEIMKEK